VAELTKNLAVSTVATAPSPATTGTSLEVAAGEGVRFPDAPFNVTVAPASGLPTPANSEIVRVTDVSTDTLTIDREEEGSSARTIAVGDRVWAGVTAKTLQDLEDYADAAVAADITTEIHGYPIEEPTVAQDQYGFVYDDGTGAMVWTEFATAADVATAVSDHSADTSVHGIADTSALVVDGDAASGDLYGTFPGPSVKALHLPYAIVSVTTQTIESGGFGEAVSFDTNVAESDPANGDYLTVNLTDDRIEVNQACVCLVTYFGSWGINAAGDRKVSVVRSNSSGTPQRAFPTALTPAIANTTIDQWLTVIDLCASGDRWAATCYQTSGADRTLTSRLTVAVLTL
jgi:hypothetical protein